MAYPATDADDGRKAGSSAQPNGANDSPGCFRSLFCCCFGRDRGGEGGGTVGLDAGADSPQQPKPPRPPGNSTSLARRARNSVLIYHAQAAKRPPQQPREGKSHASHVFLDGAVTLARRARDSVLIFRPGPKVGPEPPGAAGLSPQGPGPRGVPQPAAAGPTGARGGAAQAPEDDACDQEVQVVAVAQLLLPAGGAGGVVGGPEHSKGVPTGEATLPSDSGVAGKGSARDSKIAGARERASSRRGAWEGD